MDEPRDVRCGDNPFNTLLFKLDTKGIYVYCRDCRREAGKRGKEHFYSWMQLLSMAMAKALGIEIDDQFGGGTGVHHQRAEGGRDASSPGG